MAAEGTRPATCFPARTGRFNEAAARWPRKAPHPQEPQMATY